MGKKKLLWFFISILIAILIIWAITSQSASFSLKELYEDIINANKGWFALGVLCMLGFVYFEGRALNVILKELGKTKAKLHGGLYSASDIFFSAITPSATGGQPVSAYFIMKDGISGSVAMIALLINLIMYTFALMLTGGISLIVKWQMFREYELLARVFICIGFVVLLFFAIAFLMLVFKENLMYKIVDKLFKLLVKIRLIHNVDKKRDKIEFLMEEYRSCAEMLLEHKVLLVKTFFYNMMQRVCQISVCSCLFLAVGGKIKDSFDMWSIQCLAYVGSTTVPVPGAQGVIDYLLLEGFSHVSEIDSIANMELLIRGVSFYICVGLCGIITLIGYFKKPKELN